MRPGIAFETCAWERDPDELALIPKSRRRKILPTYEAAIPASIAAEVAELPPNLERRGKQHHPGGKLVDLLHERDGRAVQHRIGCLRCWSSNQL